MSKQIFCSSKCNRLSHIKPEKEKECKYCGVRFLANRTNQVYCSKKCIRGKENALKRLRGANKKMNRKYNNELE